MPKCILVADDDADMRLLLQTCLADRYELELVANGRQALAAIAAQPDRHDAVILDLMMPDMTGFDVLEHLRADPMTEALPVIVLTARSDRDAKLDAYVGGGHVFISKPFDKNDLLDTVAGLLRRSPAARQAGRLERLINIKD